MVTNHLMFLSFIISWWFYYFLERDGNGVPLLINLLIDGDVPSFPCLYFSFAVTCANILNNMLRTC